MKMTEDLMKDIRGIETKLRQYGSEGQSVELDNGSTLSFQKQKMADQKTARLRVCVTRGGKTAVLTEVDSTLSEFDEYMRGVTRLVEEAREEALKQEQEKADLAALKVLTSAAASLAETLGKPMIKEALESAGVDEKEAKTLEPVSE